MRGLPPLSLAESTEARNDQRACAKRSAQEVVRMNVPGKGAVDTHNSCRADSLSRRESTNSKRLW